MAEGNVARAVVRDRLPALCVTRMAGAAGVASGCGLARAARLFTAVWAMTEAIVRELEAQKTQKEMLSVLLFAEDIEELSAVCCCGAGRVVCVTACSRGGESWAAERVCRDAAHVRTMECVWD